MPIISADFWSTLLDRLKTDKGRLIRVLTYFQHFGRLAGTIIDWVQNLDKAVAEFRATAGLPLSGGIDDDLMNAMNRPRCGCLDVQRQGVELAKWRKTKLTYFVAQWVNGISQSDQADILALGWKQWQDHCGITLTRANVQAGADIVIATGSGQAQGFDGPGSTLAWAYLPSNDQQLLMRFDIAEKWIAAGAGGILMLNVACHEFGHLLGLDHSRQNSALMAPFYSPGITRPQPVDDIPRIQALYGPAPTPIPPVVPPVPPITSTRRTITIEIAGDVVGGSIPGYNLVKPLRLGEREGADNPEGLC